MIFVRPIKLPICQLTPKYQFINYYNYVFIKHILTWINKSKSIFIYTIRHVSECKTIHVIFPHLTATRIYLHKLFVPDLIWRIIWRTRRQRKDFSLLRLDARAAAVVNGSRRRFAEKCSRYPSKMTSTSLPSSTWSSKYRAGSGNER